jgi:hypothetical protein
MRGDQVYADPLWETIPELREWNKLPVNEAQQAEFTESLRAEVDAFSSTSTV